MTVNDQNISQLLNVIEKVRRRRISDSGSLDIIRYIDPNNYIDKLCVSNNHIVQGRRGSGKTTLLLKRIERELEEVPIIIDCQPLKNYRSNDIILIIIAKIITALKNSFTQEEVANLKKSTRFLNKVMVLFNKSKKAEFLKAKQLLELYKLIERSLSSIESMQKQPEEKIVNRKIERNYKEQKVSKISSNVAIKNTGQIAGNLQYGLVDKISVESIVQIQNMISASDEYQAVEELSIAEDSEEKIIKNKGGVIRDAKEGICELFNVFYKIKKKKIVLFLDDFYLISEADQINIIHYLHDIYKVSFDSSFCFKISVLPHRFKLNPDGNYDLSIKDDFSPIRLDYDLADFENLKKHLITILINLDPSLGLSVQDIRNCYANDDVINYSIIASGGIPRDFIVLFGDLVTSVIKDNRDSISKENIYSLVNELKEEKDQNIEYDSDISPEKIRESISEITDKIVRKNKTNVFLYSRERSNEEDNILRNLVNLRYIHPIKENISSEIVKIQTFDAYLVDMIFYATRQRMPRDFNFREFWVRDKEQRQPVLHRSPILKFDVKN